MHPRTKTQQQEETLLYYSPHSKLPRDNTKSIPSSNTTKPEAGPEVEEIDLDSFEAELSNELKEKLIVPEIIELLEFENTKITGSDLVTGSKTGNREKMRGMTEMAWEDFAAYENFDQIIETENMATRNMALEANTPPAEEIVHAKYQINDQDSISDYSDSYNSYEHSISDDSDDLDDFNPVTDSYDNSYDDESPTATESVDPTATVPTTIDGVDYDYATTMTNHYENPTPTAAFHDNEFDYNEDTYTVIASPENSERKIDTSDQSQSSSIFQSESDTGSKTGNKGNKIDYDPLVAHGVKDELGFLLKSPNNTGNHYP